MFLSALHLYPVKSCRGLSVSAAELDQYGLVGDRRFLVVAEATGIFLTQRSHPRMALIETALSPETLQLAAAGHGSIAIPLHASFGERSVTVWKNKVLADDCGDAPAAWLSAYLGLRLRLVRMGKNFLRPVNPRYARPGDEVSFADAKPLLVISEASLADLNSRLAVPLPMNRFRPNLVVSGCAAFAEDTWHRIRIGGSIFRNAGPCARCIVTTTDQLTGERSQEPLKTLATYRRDPIDRADVNFGMNLINESKTGQLHLNAEVEGVELTSPAS